jgi:hypothetical protein
MSSCQDELFRTGREEYEEKKLKAAAVKGEAYVCGPFTEKKHDPVDHPSHYNQGKIEVADFIADQQLNFDRGNAVKYICRAGAKGDAELTPTQKAIQDLEKAVWYLTHEIKWIRTHGIPG